jgi:hypothetical protein
VAAIEGLEDARKVVGDFDWDDLRTVRRLTWEADQTRSNQCGVELTIECREREPRFALTVYFSGVQRLRILDFGCPVMRIIGLYIKDISDRQWEDIRWEVGDYEDDEIAFFCAEIRVVSSRLLAPHECD